MNLIKKLLQWVSDGLTRSAVFEVLYSLYSNQPITSAGLVTNTSAVNLGASAFFAIVNGITVTKAANTALPALTGLNLVNGNFVALLFGIDQSANLYTVWGPITSSYGNLQYPALPDGVVAIGGALINDVSAGAFTGGTTSLATAGLTVTYWNEQSPFYPVNLR